MALPLSRLTRFSFILKLTLCAGLLTLLLSTSTFASGDSFTGRVVDVADGDTITVLTPNQEKVKIRLSGVDCPESFQAHGEKAKRFTSSMVSGKRVRLEPETIDKYGRTVAMVFVNGENLNEQIVAHGHGWVFRKYCIAYYCNDWLKLEATARDAQVGLWADKNPIAPWEWRQQQRSGVSGSGSNATAAVIAPSPQPKGSSMVYHGNTRSHVFHGPGCKDYNCKNCTVLLGSVQEAVGAGYRGHQGCVK